MTDVNLHMLLEMRKTKVGFGWHFLHFILTMFTGIWVFVWVAHALSVYSHNRGIEKQQDMLVTHQIIASKEVQ
jgi:hypothetical protein